ncbi:Nuclear pore complex protein [Nosema granulosis]|uniref:Nuclear pore complex protein n=1 Tax=Nosema granulosis TaxID=83296 RepID=A0A9P6GX67_9MICR|nr:Nuclear pore complex protein [Nosema granulosis]
MNKMQLYEETRAYEERIRPSSKEIFQNSAQSYSNQRYLRKIKEYGVPQQDFDKCGILPELAVIWYAKACKLFLWRYESNEMEEISTFSSEVQFVDIFKPKEGIFNHKISSCILVITEDQAMVYGVERDTGFLVNTDMVASIPCLTRCYEIVGGNIYIGCVDGNIYEIVYKGNESWVFKNMYLYDPNASLLNWILRRKKPEIKAMSSNGRFLVVLSRGIGIYNIEGGIYKVRDVVVTKEYVGVQVVDSSEGDGVLFYCILKDGTRDFYKDSSHELVLTKKCTLNDSVSEILNLKIESSRSRFCLVHKSQYQGALVGFVQFNDFQRVNFDKHKPCENQEILSLKEEVVGCRIFGDELFFVTRSKIMFYEILSPRKYITCSRIEDVYNVFKNYGERESLVLYYQLLSNNEDVSKIEYLCLKNEQNRIQSLSSLLYRELRSILYTPIRNLWEDERKIEVERIQYRFTNLIKKDNALDLLDLFVQSVFYISLLVDYSIDLDNMNFYRLLFCEEEDFKKRTLQELIEVFKANQSVDPLINTLGNKAPLYLPVDEVFYQRGFDLLKKYPSRDRLWESLKNFRNILFNEEVIKKYNELGFFSGSLTLIRQHFEFSFEREVELLKSCVLCQGAVNQGLEDTREEFMYAFFEALCSNLKTGTFSSRSCTCCDTSSTSSMSLSSVIKIQSPFLERFLHEKTISENDPRVFELHWKYLAYRNERVKAARSLLYLADNKKISLDQRIDLLEKARTVSLHTDIANEIRLRFELLEIQKTLVARGVSDPIISNVLLSADELFNDYTYKFPDLALKIISISSFLDKNVISEYWAEGMKGDFKAATSFLLNNKLEGPVMDLDIISTILLKKMDIEDDLCKVLLEAGFNYYEIKRMLQNKSKKENHPNIRNLLLKELNSLKSQEPKCKKIEKLCIPSKY